jgi:hypothetical protein
MSGERPVPREPFVHLTKTLDVTRPVTLSDVSEQVSALAAHVGSVHREVALTRSELGELRTLVTTDHAPRISRVEQKASSIPPGVKTAGKYGAVASLIPIIEWAYPLVKQYLESR